MSGTIWHSYDADEPVKHVFVCADSVMIAAIDGKFKVPRVTDERLSDGFMCRKFSDDNSESEQEDVAAMPAGYYEEQEAIRQR